MKISSPDLQRIHSLFSQFDCNKRDVDLYLNLLELGAVSIQELARAMKQNRVTVHSSIEKLIEKGFVYETRKGKRRLVAAENPHTLHQLLERKENELDLMRSNMDYVSELLSKFHTHSQSQPTVKFYEEADGIKRMLEESLKAKRKTMYVFSYAQRLAELVDPEYLERYFARRSKKDISSRLILATGPFSKKMKTKSTQYKVDIRFLDPNVDWKSGIFSWDNTVAFMSYTEGKVTCTVVENEDIATFFQKVMFELCWQQASSSE